MKTLSFKYGDYAFSLMFDQMDIKYLDDQCIKIELSESDDIRLIIKRLQELLIAAGP